MPAPGDYDFSYVEKLKNIDLILCEEYKGAKQHHKMKCLICNHVFIATPISKIQNYKKWGKGGCPNCTKIYKQQQFQITRQANIEKLKERFDILSDYDGKFCLDKNGNAFPVTVRNKQCGHIFTSSSKNIIASDIVCPVCNAARKRAAFQQFNIDRSIEYHKNASAWDSYRDTVYLLTTKTYNKHKNIINPNNLTRGSAGTPGAYQVDHIVPVRYCFDHNIPAEACAHYINLQMLTWEENLLTRQHLKEGVEIPKIIASYM